MRAGVVREVVAAELCGDGSRQMRARCVVDTSGGMPATKAGDAMAEFGKQVGSFLAMIGGI